MYCLTMTAIHQLLRNFKRYPEHQITNVKKQP